ncbi:uncharacterized protein MONOS_8150 [Monocercomonoides exilis]|uniref:uncharacterized protein n=1 Tax=Monocercomonoides exilis TaxID=2049356 RepID=UPI0035596CEC|nr:hypothetical protein MONOS_8150 [Monocercomonoides exilis]|eukprot:MONOS_8150.1-p1 / transcript=MONOS_8150.1 / gene=MONOS_8150 / organism=Monocercomonoides_exilis_PA203 / gene_product=unspecified product / transcript_product=unspecified product / location=Mono_scaffold00298:58541-58868(+) / protein_length=92 / sequence_SO=supercontig / SO=protein_coding / is_pseudo=false
MRKKKMRMQLDQNEAEKRCRARAEDAAITSRTLQINADIPQNNFSERVCHGLFISEFVYPDRICKCQCKKEEDEEQMTLGMLLCLGEKAER